MTAWQKELPRDPSGEYIPGWYRIKNPLDNLESVAELSRAENGLWEFRGQGISDYVETMETSFLSYEYYGPIPPDTV